MLHFFEKWIIGFLSFFVFRNGKNIEYYRNKTMNHIYIELFIERKRNKIVLLDFFEMWIYFLSFFVFHNGKNIEYYRYKPISFILYWIFFLIEIKYLSFFLREKRKKFYIITHLWVYCLYEWYPNGYMNGIQ